MCWGETSVSMVLKHEVTISKTGLATNFQRFFICNFNNGLFRQVSLSYFSFLKFSTTTLIVMSTSL